MEVFHALAARADFCFRQSWRRKAVPVLPTFVAQPQIDESIAWTPRSEPWETIRFVGIYHLTMDMKP